MTEPKYRWAYPLLWFEEYIERNDVDGRAEALRLARLLDSDQLQDEYQDLMSEDGYFDPLGAEQ